MGARHTAGVGDNAVRSAAACLAGHLESRRGPGTCHDAHLMGSTGGSNGELLALVPSTKEAIAMR